MSKIGFGYDIHRLVVKKGGCVRLCAATILANYYVCANSDGDVALHALANALLGSLGLEDIGYYFPVLQTPKGYDSQKIITFVLKKLEEALFEIGNLDITLVCDLIRFEQYKQLFKQNLSILLNISVTNISVKATTSEGSQTQYLSCYANVLITK